MEAGTHGKGGRPIGGAGSAGSKCERREYGEQHEHWHRPGWQAAANEDATRDGEAEHREVRPRVEREAKGGAGGQRYGGASEHDRERPLGDPVHGPGDQGHGQRRQDRHATPPCGRTRRPVCPTIHPSWWPATRPPLVRGALRGLRVPAGSSRVEGTRAAVGYCASEGRALRKDRRQGQWRALPLDPLTNLRRGLWTTRLPVRSKGHRQGQSTTPLRVRSTDCPLGLSTDRLRVRLTSLHRGRLTTRLRVRSTFLHPGRWIGREATCLASSAYAPSEVSFLSLRLAAAAPELCTGTLSGDYRWPLTTFSSCWADARVSL
jgi:hypothetical protein